jgi:hypothetical protein
VGSIYVNRILHPDPSKVAPERKEIKIHGSPLETFGGRALNVALEKHNITH